MSATLYKQGVFQQLMQLGLTHVQAQIYLATLAAKRTTVLQISRDTGIQRPTIYDNVKELERHMLVSTVVDSGRKYLVPNDPRALASMLKHKEVVLGDVLPSLEAEYKVAHPQDADVRFFRGEEGLQALADVLLTSKEKVIRTIADYERNIEEPFSERYLRKLWNARSRKHIHGKILYTTKSVEKLRQNKDYSEIGNIRYDREVRILPEAIKLSVLYTLVDNRVLFWGTKHEDVAFQFVSKSYADSLKSMFDYLWEVSTPFPER